MREHWARRPMAGALLGLFLLLTVGLGEARHVCPVHDPALAAAVALGAHGGAHAPVAGHEQKAAVHQPPGDHQSGHDHAQCCCTGLACLVNAVTLPSQRLELPTVAIVTSSAPELPEYARSAAASAYFIPFANGPPTLSERSA